MSNFRRRSRVKIPLPTVGNDAVVDSPISKEYHDKLLEENFMYNFMGVATKGIKWNNTDKLILEIQCVPKISFIKNFFSNISIHFDNIISTEDTSNDWSAIQNNLKKNILLSLNSQHYVRPGLIDTETGSFFTQKHDPTSDIEFSSPIKMIVESNMPIDNILSIEDETLEKLLSETAVIYIHEGKSHITKIDKSYSFSLLEDTIFKSLNDPEFNITDIDAYVKTNTDFVTYFNTSVKSSEEISLFGDGETFISSFASGTEKIFAPAYHMHHTSDQTIFDNGSGFYNFSGVVKDLIEIRRTFLNNKERTDAQNIILNELNKMLRVFRDYKDSTLYDVSIHHEIINMKSVVEDHVFYSLNDMSDTAYYWDGNTKVYGNAKLGTSDIVIPYDVVQGTSSSKRYVGLSGGVHTITYANEYNKLVSEIGYIGFADSPNMVNVVDPSLIPRFDMRDYNKNYEVSQEIDFFNVYELHQYNDASFKQEIDFFNVYELHQYNDASFKQEIDFFNVYELHQYKDPF